MKFYTIDYYYFCWYEEVCQGKIAQFYEANIVVERNFFRGHFNWNFKMNDFVKGIVYFRSRNFAVGNKTNLSTYNIATFSYYKSNLKNETTSRKLIPKTLIRKQVNILLLPYSVYFVVWILFVSACTRRRLQIGESSVKHRPINQ